MKEIPSDLNLHKNKGQVILEYVLLAICLGVIALRTTYTESPSIQSASPANLTNNLYSVSVSATLFISFIIWFTYGLCTRKFLYRFTSIEIGLLLFCIAAVIASFAASNKRAAVTDSVCLIAPILMAILLVQILDSPPKIKLVLVVIAALGVVSAYQCADQFFTSNQVMIDQYESDPQSILEPLGIQPGSIQQFFLEHRLYSKDIRGFFTNGNSAGSFAMLAAFTAVAVSIGKFKRRSPTAGPFSIITSAVAIVIIVLGLILTHSKGAILASLTAAAIFIVLLYFGNWLQKHKKAVVLACLLLFITAVGAVAAYGLTHGRLPGGSSMLVRWQYWHASAKMYADHPLTGVGPGNFANFYMHYKPPEALESVSNPHNFLLAILSQYGPLGLLGFLALVFIPLWKIIPSLSHDINPLPQTNNRPSSKTLAITYFIIISIALLLIRPMIMPTPLGDTLDVFIYLIFTLYIAPVIVFAVGFWLLTADEKEETAHNTGITAALLCAVLAVLLHNLIDFAIFEPPVLTVFWAIIACLIAINRRQNFNRQLTLSTSPLAKAIAIAAALIIIAAFSRFAFWPVYKNTAEISKAYLALSSGRPRQAQNLLNLADDPLDPTAPALSGKLYLQNYSETQNARPALLEKAEACLLTAIARDSADFENYENLSDVYKLLAKIAKKQKKTDRLNSALDSIESAVGRYPGNARLRIKMAEIAEQLGKNNIALAQYRKAVEIEDAYRRQFKTLYPQREIYSRLGEENYQTAKQQIKLLENQPAP